MSSYVMSKVNVRKDSLGNFLYGHGYVVSESITDQIVGRVLTLVEALGLPERQEESLKSLMRQAVHSPFYDDAIFISQERHGELRKLYADEKKRINGNAPIGAI